MADIKTKEIKPKSIRKIDKVKAWTERIKDSVVYTNKKINDTFDSDKGINDYGEEKIKYTANGLKDETIYANKKIVRATKNQIQKHHLNKKNKKEESIKNATNTGKKTIKTANKSIKSSEKVIKEETKRSKRILEQGKKLAINGTKKLSQGAKRIGKMGVSAIKDIMTGIKSLVAMLSVGGVFVVAIVLVFAIVGAILSSVFGIFFSSQKVENSIRMSDCIAELNDEMDNKIDLLKRNSIYDELVINSDKTSWKDVLAIYAVRVANGDDEQDVVIMNKEKKAILKEVYWDMNTITHNIVIEEYESQSLGTLESTDLTDIKNHTLPSYNNPNTETNDKRVLHINIKSKTTEEMKKKYNFSEEQLKQYDELTSEEYDNLWYGVIYGSYSDSGEIVNWKQVGKEWSNIRIGTTRKTIGGIGCLTTSIAILIKKSDVPTKNIHPFNPGTFVIALNNNYGFDSSGNLLYSAINKVVPNFKYIGTVDLRGMSKSEKLYQIKKYSDNGYFLSAEVKGATKNSQHWVAIDSVSNKNVLMLDPSSNERDMWSKYDWNKTSQFIYFKVIK